MHFLLKMINCKNQRIMYTVFLTSVDASRVFCEQHFDQRVIREVLRRSGIFRSLDRNFIGPMIQDVST